VGVPAAAPDRSNAEGAWAGAVGPPPSGKSHGGPTDADLRVHLDRGGPGGTAVVERRVAREEAVNELQDAGRDLYQRLERASAVGCDDVRPAGGDGGLLCVKLTNGRNREKI